MVPVSSVTKASRIYFLFLAILLLMARILAWMVISAPILASEIFCIRGAVFVITREIIEHVMDRLYP